jgi:predicted small secreted protein
MKVHHLLLIAIVAAFGISGCDTNDGPAEEMGEALDDTATDAGNAVEDACEDVKEGAGADDTDC